jgi:hypothetical protein
MVELVGSECGEFTFELTIYEVIGSIAIVVVEDYWVP